MPRGRRRIIAALREGNVEDGYSRINAANTTADAAIPSSSSPYSRSGLAVRSACLPMV